MKKQYKKIIKSAFIPDIIINGHCFHCSSPNSRCCLYSSARCYYYSNNALRSLEATKLSRIETSETFAVLEFFAVLKFL